MALRAVEQRTHAGGVFLLDEAGGEEAVNVGNPELLRTAQKGRGVVLNTPHSVNQHSGRAVTAIPRGRTIILKAILEE